MESTLKNLGLTPNETIVYKALAKLGGSSSAGDIIKLADLHRNIVYDALAHLENQNLVQEVEKNKKKFFTLKNPDHLVTKFERQIKSANDLAKMVSGLSNAGGHEVTIYEGTRGWQEAWQEVMRTTKPKSSFRTIGMAGDPWVKLMGETFVEYEQWALKNKITDRIVSQKHLKAEIEAHQNVTFRDIRYIDIDLAAHMSIEVFDDRVLFEIYDEPQTIIEVRSKAMVASLAAYFEMMWVMGKK
ncbi:MAG: TrmB family transcriptional regulator [Patescibacteria group bacterium]|nr:TrmB family transcriptional regulator [Patescibacteria group bacterium]